MTYNQKLVAVVKVNGKVLRDTDDVIRLPFGSEYEIYLKNLNSQRAVVNISIDGQDVLDGNRLVIDPNTEYALEGFMKDRKVRNKFKFINKTKEIADYRGDNVDDGII